MQSGFASSPLILWGPRIFINAILAALNLLPLPPLDGGRIAVGLWPAGLSPALARIEPYGFFILIALMFTGLLQLSGNTAYHPVPDCGRAVHWLGDRGYQSSD